MADEPIDGNSATRNLGKVCKKVFITNCTSYNNTTGHIDDIGDENEGATKRGNLTAGGESELQGFYYSCGVIVRFQRKYQLWTDVTEDFGGVRL